MTPEDQLNYLVTHPDELIKTRPFTRGTKTLRDDNNIDSSVRVGETITAELPRYERRIVSQSQFIRELDPNCHKVLFDENIPSITAKTSDGTYVEIEFKKMPVPFQKMIRNKHVLHLCGHGVQLTLNNTNPTERQKEDFTTLKQYWADRNQDGMRTKMVSTQQSYGNAGLLYYFDRHGRIKSRLLSYEDGYVLCSHNDCNGDRLCEAVYYKVGEVEHIDCYTDQHQYSYVRDLSQTDKEYRDWRVEVNGELHGFQEIPLITKRGDVAWNDVQDIIEVYEIIYNIFLVIQKRHGWGLLYIKGNFSEKAKKIAGAVVLNDASLNKDGSAQYLTPPTPQGMLDTLKLMEETIQKGSGTTFILPKDISTSGDISGVAIEITQSLDNEEALAGVIEWQNVASKMERLFRYGLAKELVDTEADPDAITRFGSLNVSARFKQWRPRNDFEYNQMLSTMKAAGLISQKTGVEKNTESTPDEDFRLARELEEKIRLEEEAEARKAALSETTTETSETE